MARSLQTDLFGAPVNPQERRRRDSRRKQVAQQMARLQADHIMPIDVLAGLLRDAIERADKEWMFKIAAELLPYTSPRLAAVMMGNGALMGASRLQVEWGNDHAADSAPVLAAVVSESDTPGA